MKSNLFLASFIALLFVSQGVLGQAKQYSMFEHFTQASCAPCAIQNPAFQSVYADNTANAHHVAYHTSWPGVDPMNSVNRTEVRTMVTLYGVTGVPDMIQDGISLGGPTAVSQNLIDKVPNSPMRVLITHNLVGDTMINGTVTIQMVEEKPAGDYLLRTMAVEKNIEYASAPGTNGEKEFPNVFREFVVGGDAGLAITLPEKGEEMTVDFSYEVDPAWATDEMYSLAYVQRTSNDQVINSGSSIDPVYGLYSLEDYYFRKAGNGMTTFQSSIYSIVENDVVVTIETDASSEWSHTIMLNGSPVISGDTVTLALGDSPVDLTIDGGDASGIANYLITIHEPGTNAIQRLSYFVINNVTDLVVVSDNAASGSIPVDFGAAYLAALEEVSTTTKASMGHTFLTEAAEASALEDIENIYYSIGWSFPALTDEVTAILTDFLNGGGNLMIAGQDVGWDIMSMHSASNGTPNQRTFYTDMLQTQYVDDGSSANLNFIANTDDDVFAAVAATTVSPIYTAASTFPDQINALGPDAQSIFSYSSTKNAGIKVNTGVYKVVYLGIGLEQVADVAVSNEIFRLTHDWFHGLVSNEQVDAAFAELGNAFPNPASESVQISFGQALKGDLELILVDVSGKSISTQPIAPNTSEITVDVSNLPTGVYYYQLSNGQQITTAKKLVRK